MPSGCWSHKRFLSKNLHTCKRKNEYLTRCRSWFQMLDIDASWLVTRAESGASQDDEWTKDGYYLGMDSKRTLCDFNFNNARWENLGGNYRLRRIGKRNIGNYNLKENPKMEISCTVGERTNRKLQFLKKNLKMEVSCTVGEKTNRKL